MIFTLGTLASAISSPFIGKILSKPKVNIKLLYLLDGLLSGGGMGNIFLQQLAARLLNNPEIGYQGAYFIFGIISMVVAIPVALVLIRLPKANELSTNSVKNDNKTTENTQVSGYFYSIGLDPQLVANIAPLFALFLIFGNLFGGVLFDKLGIKKSLILARITVIGCELYTC